VRISSLAVRITAWYDWLLIILILVFGAYTCKCLDHSLSVGVQNALSIRAREISTMFAATGQIPGRPGLLDSDRTIHSLQCIRESICPADGPRCRISRCDRAFDVRKQGV
jgi:hypothetical protein